MQHAPMALLPAAAPPAALGARAVRPGQAGVPPPGRPSWDRGLFAAVFAAATLPQRSSGRSARFLRVACRSRLEKRVVSRSKYPEEKPKEGDLVRIHYLGRLSDGTCFDNSRTRKRPFEFVLGENDVIDGWEALIPTMSWQEKAEFVCPPEYAYGEEGVEGIIPPNETLTFRIELLDFATAAEEEEKEEEAEVVDVDDSTAEDGEEAAFWEKDEERESGRGAAYTWEASGSGKEILIRVPLSDDVRVKQIKFNVTSTSLMCKIADKMIVEGTLFAQVLTDDSFWDFEKKDGKAYLLITLGKMDTSIRWQSLLEGGDTTSAAPAVAASVEVLGAVEAAQAVEGAKPAQ